MSQAENKLKNQLKLLSGISFEKSNSNVVKGRLGFIEFAVNVETESFKTSSGVSGVGFVNLHKYLNKEFSSEQKNKRKEEAVTCLKEHGIDFKSSNDKIHLIIQMNGIRVDFWPTTSRWMCGNETNFGLENLIEFLKQGSTSQRYYLPEDEISELSVASVDKKEVISEKTKDIKNSKYKPEVELAWVSKKLAEKGVSFSVSDGVFVADSGNVKITWDLSENSFLMEKKNCSKKLKHVRTIPNIL